MISAAVLVVAGLLGAAGAAGVHPPAPAKHRVPAADADERVAPAPISWRDALSVSSAPYCSGEYADDFAALSPAARGYDERSDKQYTYCVRTSATYECVSYGADGNLKRDRRHAVAHGTAFAYRKVGGDTLLLTNEHVAEWPAVTDAEHPVDGVPRGCKRVSESVKLVDDEADAYERDDIPLSRVVVDPQLDAAVLKTRAALHIMPWKIGRSAGLRERNVVQVRGFPLGAFKAVSVGKVISAYDHDEDRDWDHDDFVIDALLSPGNSGSPVFAVSCRTGEPELVGMYHAGYTGGSALNVVVAVDQLRDLMFTLKRKPRPRSEAAALDAKSRAELYALASRTPEPFFPFGGQSALVRPRPDGSLFFALMPKGFPLQTVPLVVIEDLPPEGPTEFGAIGRVWFGSAQGLKGYARSALDSDAQAQLQHVLDGMRHDALAAFHYATAARSGDVSRQKFEEMSKRERSVRKAMAARGELEQAMGELAERLAPRSAEVGLRLAEVYGATPAVALPASRQPGGRVAATREAATQPAVPRGPVQARPKHPGPVSP